MSYTLQTSAGYTYVVGTAAINAAKNGTRDLVAAGGAGTQIWVLGVAAGTDADGTATFLDSGPNTHTGAIPMLVAGDNGINWPTVTHPDYAWIKCATNTKLQVTLSVNSDFDGVLVYATVTLAP